MIDYRIMRLPVLASLASQGSLEGLLRDFVLEDQVTETDLVDGAVLRTVDGNDFLDRRRSDVTGREHPR